MLKIDREKLVSLLHDFYRLTDIKICLFDESGHEIACVPEHLCAFCAYVRSSKSGSAACEKSDADAFTVCRQTAAPYVYTCHMGLTECVSPVSQQGRVIGFLMLGQTASGEGSKESFFEKIRDKIVRYSLDEAKAEELYAAVEFSPADKVRAAVSVLDACAGYVYLHKLVAEGESVSAKISGYAENHLDGDLSVETLCKISRLSRVDLYACVKAAFGCTPADFVRNLRLARAAELLSTPVSVTRIAQKVGICDYNYFSKIFRAHYGISPRAYRKRLADSSSRLV